jgi:hypothetical protein
MLLLCHEGGKRRDFGFLRSVSGFGAKTNQKCGDGRLRPSRGSPRPTLDYSRTLSYEPKEPKAVSSTAIHPALQYQDRGHPIDRLPTLFN